jgi:Protein of unknown function (DUF2628)
MNSHNPYAPPASAVGDIEEIGLEEQIDALSVSDKWKERFKAIQRTGGVKFPNLKSMPRKERRKAYSFNALAFLFGPIYYMAKGMWRKGLSLFFVCALVVVVLSLALELSGFGKLANSLGYGVSAIFAMRANIDFYKKMVLHENGWW